MEFLTQRSLHYSKDQKKREAGIVSTTSVKIRGTIFKKIFF